MSSGLIIHARIHGREDLYPIELPLDATLRDLKKAISTVNPMFVVIEGYTELPDSTLISDTGITNDSIIGVFIKEYDYFFFRANRGMVKPYRLIETDDGTYYNPTASYSCYYKKDWVESRDILTHDVVESDRYNKFMPGEVFLGVQKVLATDFDSITNHMHDVLTA